MTYSLKTDLSWNIIFIILLELCQPHNIIDLPSLQIKYRFTIVICHLNLLRFHFGHYFSKRELPTNSKRSMTIFRQRSKYYYLVFYGWVYYLTILSHLLIHITMSYKVDVPLKSFHLGIFFRWHISSMKSTISRLLPLNQDHLWSGVVTL